jgi:hypothetical protein
VCVYVRALVCVCVRALVCVCTHVSMCACMCQRGVTHDQAETELIYNVYNLVQQSSNYTLASVEKTLNPYTILRPKSASAEKKHTLVP